MQLVGETRKNEIKKRVWIRAPIYSPNCTKTPLSHRVYVLNLQQHCKNQRTKPPIAIPLTQCHHWAGTSEPPLFLIFCMQLRTPLIFESDKESSFADQKKRRRKHLWFWNHHRKIVDLGVYNSPFIFELLRVEVASVGGCGSGGCGQWRVAPHPPLLNFMYSLRPKLLAPFGKPCILQTKNNVFMIIFFENNLHQFFLLNEIFKLV